MTGLFIVGLQESLFIDHNIYSYFEKGCWKNVHVTVQKGNMGYHQYPVPDTVAVESSIVAFF